MASKWRTFTLGEITVNHDGKRKPVKESQRRAGPYPYYGASGIVDYVDDYLLDGDYLLIAEDGENLRSRKTPIAFMARGKSWVNNHAHIVTGNDKADTRFLMYALQGMDIGGYLTGAVMPKLTQGNLNKIEIECPPLEEQRAIARVLGALDDKIELNRRSNDTLEAMARALFKSWFVDFDGVARSELIESEVGLIPKKWRADALGNHLVVLETGRRPKGGVKDISGGVPSVGAESIIGIGQFDFGKTKFVAEDFFVGMKSGHAKSLDVMLYKDGGKPGDFRPRVSMFGEGFPFERYAINEHVFRMRSESLGQAYLFLQISHERILNDLRNRGGKAAIPGINQKDVTTLQVLVPDDSVIRSFNSLAMPMLEAILKRANESRTLAQLRDALLPKLLSGDLRVKGAEYIAMESA